MYPLLSTYAPSISPQAAIFSCPQENNFPRSFPSSGECVLSEPFPDAQEKGGKDQTGPPGVPTETLQDLQIIQ